MIEGECPMLDVKTSKSNAEKFIGIYNEIDRYMRKSLDEDERIGHVDLIKKMVKKSRVFAKNKDELMLFARLRNSIVHNPYNSEIDPIAEPHEKIVIKYKDIRDKVLDPARALDTIAVTGKKIYSVTEEEFVVDVMEIMKDNGYANVPVVDKEGMITGVFSENTVFSYIIENEGAQIRRSTKISEFMEFTPMERHESEFFVFVPKNSLVIEVEELFQKKLKGKKKLALVFITETGKVKEKILGLVTAWDIASNYK